MTSPASDAGPATNIAADRSRNQRSHTSAPSSDSPDRLSRVDFTIFGLVAIAGLVARFATTSPMWLDEALTVNIASLPLSDISGALRHDGHPPLFYVLLHYWMKVFGTSNVAVRALPGIFGVGFVVALWFATQRTFGRRSAWAATWIALLLPFAVRYSTEARMYSLVMLLVTVGWIALDRALESGKLGPLAGLAGCTALLLWTHYWAIWLGLVTAIGVFGLWVLARRRGESAAAGNALRVIAALGVGAVTFVPWLGTLAYQSAHTGTPWGSRAWPPTVVARTISGFGVGESGDQLLVGIVVVLCVLLGLFATARGRFTMDLDVRTVPIARRATVAAIGTLGVAAIVLVATNGAFQARYNAIWIPLILMIGGRGMAQLNHRWALRAVALGFAVLASAGIVRNMVLPRTQARDVAHAITAAAPNGAVVAVCPDQLGPGLLRELHGNYDVGAYPDFSRPDLIDWVDYRDRLATADPAAFAAKVLARANDKPIFLVWAGTYATHQGTCEAVAASLQANRSDAHVLVVADADIWEPSGLIAYRGARDGR